MGERIEVTTSVAAPAGRVYELVADITRMGEWSPETTGCRWLGDDRAALVGARFKGDNANGRHRWSSTCTIVAADPGREVAWDVRYGPVAVARWSYRMSEDGTGTTTVTESTEDARPRWFKAVGRLGTGVRDRAEHNRVTMAETLTRIKSAAEAR